MHPIPSSPSRIPSNPLGILALLCFLGLPLRVDAFEVIKDINKEPVEKLVIFDKTKPAKHLSFVDGDNCKLSFTEDGSIEYRITGNSPLKAMIKWKGNGLPDSFKLKTYDYLILTCRMEGTVKQTMNGKTSDLRPDNLWFPIVLFNDAGEVLGSGSLADPTPDKRTPDKTTVLKFPIVQLTFWGPGKGDVSAVGFTWSKTHDNQSRDFRVIVDKIAFAND